MVYIWNTEYKVLIASANSLTEGRSILSYMIKADLTIELKKLEENQNESTMNDSMVAFAHKRHDEYMEKIVCDPDHQLNEYSAVIYDHINE